MGAALRVAGRHDTATSAAPPTPRVQAPRGAGALARAAAASLAAAALYTLACPPHEWSLLAWLVPGLLLVRSEEHTSELQSRFDLVCRLLLEKKKKQKVRVRLTARRSSASTALSATRRAW